MIGARGYVGSRLTRRLVEEGHEVVAIGRHADGLPSGPGIEARTADAGDAATMAQALAGCGRAYYLVHSLAGGAGFANRDRDLASSFVDAATEAGVGRIVYLGGLGRGELSAHLASRQEVGAVLAGGAVPVIELRAAVVLGSGSMPFEMLRCLTERLPFMVCPRWIRTRIQPIAEVDLLAHLVRAADDDVPADIYEIGGPEVTTYREMIAAYARVRGLRRRRIIDIPLLTPGLSAHWVDLVTPIDRATSHALIDSLGIEVAVADPDATARVFGVRSMGVDEALRVALADQVEALPGQLFDLPPSGDGVYAMREQAPIAPDDVKAVREGLRACGGSLSWYGLAWAWRIRILVGRLFGERLSLHRPDAVSLGSTVDWWTVVFLDADTLVLRTDRWFCGEAWLGYRIEPDGPRIHQVGALRTKGILGVAYWRAVWPIHLVVFELMAKRQATVKRRAACSA